MRDRLDRSPKSLYTASEPTIIDILNTLLQCRDLTTKIHMLSLILRLPVFNLQPNFITSLVITYTNEDSEVRDITYSTTLMSVKK